MPSEQEFSGEQSRQIAALIREEIARRRMSRQQLADKAKLSLLTNRTNPYPAAFSTGCRAGPGQTRPNITLARRQCHPTNAEALRRS